MRVEQYSLWTNYTHISYIHLVLQKCSNPQILVQMTPFYFYFHNFYRLLISSNTEFVQPLQWSISKERLILDCFVPLSSYMNYNINNKNFYDVIDYINAIKDYIH